MRVLHVYTGNLYGGIETLLVTLARERNLCPAMLPSFLLCFGGRLQQELQQAGVPVYQLGEVRVRQPWTVLRARSAMRGIVRNERFDVVISHSAWPHAIFGPVARRAGVPLVFWLHNATDGTHWLERWARLTPPDMVLANSRFVRATVVGTYPNCNTVCLYCPVAVNGNKGVNRAEVRAELATAPDSTVIIQVSRMEPWKGHELHLHALARIARDAGWTCWMVGGAQRYEEHEYLQRLRQLAQTLGIGDRVHFLGQRADVQRLLLAADIHCQPNLGPEPFGIAFIEGLGAGLPVVTTTLGAATEVVTNACGRLVPPANPAALASALQELVRDPNLRQTLGCAGRMRARLLCDPSRQLAALHGLLGSLQEKN